MKKEMMFNRVRDGKICETYAMETGPGFYEQITGKEEIPEKLDNDLNHIINNQQNFNNK